MTSLWSSTCLGPIQVSSPKSTTSQAVQPRRALTEVLVLKTSQSRLLRTDLNPAQVRKTRASSVASQLSGIPERVSTLRTLQSMSQVAIKGHLPKMNLASLRTSTRQGLIPAQGLKTSQSQVLRLSLTQDQLQKITIL